MKQLSGLEPHEVSLVPRGANKKKYLVLKSGEKCEMTKEDLLKMIQGEPDVMQKVEELMAGHVAKDKLTSEGRKHIAEDNFAIPSERKYPIHDISHARNALARSSGKPEEEKVKAAVYRKYPSLKPNVQKNTNLEGPLDDKAQSAIKAVVRILTPFKESLSGPLIHEVLDAAGFQMAAAENQKGDHMESKAGSATMSPEKVKSEHHIEAMKVAKEAYKSHMAKLGYQKYPTEEIAQKDGDQPYGEKGKVVGDDHVQDEEQEGTIHDPAGAEKSMEKAFGHQMEDDDDDEDGEEMEKNQKIAKSLLKGLPKESRKALEHVFKAQSELIEKNSELQNKLEAVTKTARRRDFIEKAAGFSHLGVDREKLADTFLALSESAPEQLDAVQKMLSAANEQVKKGNLFKEFGSSQGTSGGDAWARLEQAAVGFVAKSGEKLTKEESVARFLETTEGKNMYSEYTASKEGR